ncbi:MAG: zinc transporter ZupT [Bacteroidetes bacterium]|nr:MAG: zinc transporter ZupT [Bacteroidota bacterium]
MLDHLNDHQNVLLAFGLTLFAGLSTGIGSAIAFFAKSTNTRFLSVSLGFSAGVMIYVSFMEIMPKSIEVMADDISYRSAYVTSIMGFFAGMLLIAIIDKLVPSFENPHEIRKVEDLDSPEELKKRKLYRMGMMSAFAIAIHNFPEGLATFIVALQDIKLGLPIAIAIAIHNIPEGIAISVPIYYATGSRKKAFKYSFLSGLAEPLGAVVGFLILMPFLNDVLFGFIFASVAGIMVFISIDELLPAAREYDQPHLSLYGLIGGMAVMALSLVMFL